MKFVNRISLIITPRDTTHQWLVSNEFEDVPSLEELSSESSCYLVDEPQQEQPLSQLIDQLLELHGPAIWHSEFGVWDEYQDHSPQYQSSTQFKQWFDVSISGLTFDLSTEPLMVANVD